MPLSIELTKLRPHRMGEELTITVRIAREEEGAPSQGERREEDTDRVDIRELTIASEMLFEIGNIGVRSLPYRLTSEQLDRLADSAALWEVVKKGITLLSYGDQTRRTLAGKLRQRGFSRELSEEAADYLAAHGYIREEQLLLRQVTLLARTKLYGPSRIRLELQKKGISSEILQNELPELLADIDFEETLRQLLYKKCDVSRLSDRKYRESLYAALYRLGYAPSETRAAVKKLQENEYE